MELFSNVPKGKLLTLKEVNRANIYVGENWINHALNAFSNTTDLTGLAESHLLKAKILRYQGRYQESLNLLESAIPDLSAEEMEERFDLTLERSYTLMLCGRFEAAVKVLSKALKLAEQRGDSVLMTYFYEGLSTVYYAWGYFDRSLYYGRRGMAISPDKTLRNYSFQDSVGPIYQDWGNIDQAFEYLQQSVTAKENFGLTEALPSAYFQLAYVLQDRGDLLMAEEYYRKALMIMEDHGGDHVVRNLCYLLLAVCLGTQGRLAEAEALVIKSRNESKNQSEYISALFQAAEALFLLQTGNIKTAYPLLQRAVQIMEPIGTRKPLCILYSALAHYGLMQSNEEDVLEYTGKALQLAAEMDYAHDFLVYYEPFQPLLYLGLEKGLEVPFLQRIMVRLGEKAVPLLQRVACHVDSEVRLRSIKPLAQIGGGEAQGTLKKLFLDEDGKVSELARRSLHKPEIIAISVVEAVREDKEVLKLELLGPIRIYAAKKEITHTKWIRSKSRDLLIYLAHLGCPIDKTKIMDAFWPEIPYKQANTLFHTTLHNLRRILENECGRKDIILCRGGQYYITPGSIMTDIHHFQELLGAVRHDSYFSETSVTLLEEAVALYRSDYLGELDYTWILPEQEYLKQLHNRARDRLSLYYANRNDYRQAIIHLERLVQDNPLTEEYYYRLITACAGIGDMQSISLKYHRLRFILNEELGLSPSGKIQELYNRLIASY